MGIKSHIDPGRMNEAFSVLTPPEDISPDSGEEIGPWAESGPIWGMVEKQNIPERTRERFVSARDVSVKDVVISIYHHAGLTEKNKLKRLINNGIYDILSIEYDSLNFIDFVYARERSL